MIFASVMLILFNACGGASKAKIVLRLRVPNANTIVRGRTPNEFYAVQSLGTKRQLISISSDGRVEKLSVLGKDEILVGTADDGSPVFSEALGSANGYIQAMISGVSFNSLEGGTKIQYKPLKPSTTVPWKGAWEVFAPISSSCFDVNRKTGAISTVGKIEGNTREMRRPGSDRYDPILLQYKLENGAMKLFRKSNLSHLKLEFMSIALTPTNGVSVIGLSRPIGSLAKVVIDSKGRALIQFKIGTIYPESNRFPQLLTISSSRSIPLYSVGENGDYALISTSNSEFAVVRFR